MGGKRSPFEREKNRFVLQERDKRILAVLYDYRFLTNEQVQILLIFGCLTRVNIRLRKLYDNQYLSRNFLANPFGRAKIVHLIGPEAVNVLSEDLKIDPAIVGKNRRRFLKMRESDFRRYLLFNDLRINLVLACRKLPEVAIETVMMGRQTLLKSEKTFYPDIYFRCRRQNQSFNFFVEMEDGSTRGKRFQEKMEKYLKYGLEGYFEKQFGFKFFRVLIVCPGQTRLKTLLNAVQRKTDKMFWLTTWEMMAKDRIFDNIWVRPNKEGLFSILEV